ncbi:uncharacterized protein [Arachis hypogaea]|uniref:uncharacterized protein n=1 Tax=Arachis hypogaea TaxID=3818 RepID=UPI003B217C08
MRTVAGLYMLPTTLRTITGRSRRSWMTTLVQGKPKADWLIRSGKPENWALGDARAVVYGDATAQYRMVMDYGLTLLKSNPGCTVTVGVIPQPNPDDEPIFDKMYIYLDACKKGFLAGCRPLIGMVGLIHAVKEVFPSVHHRFCVWYLWKNFNKQWKDLQLRGLLWDCARCTSQDGFLEIIKKIERVNKDAWEYLNKWPRDSWSRAFFSNAPKIDNICSNACEVFNSRIKEARAKPIITFLEEVRMYAMRSIARNKVKLSSNTMILPPIQRSRLEKIRKESKSWVPMWSGDSEYEKFEVHGWPTNMVVDLGKRLCTCGFWQLSGMPCVHACAALARVGRRPDEFCHQ